MQPIRIHELTLRTVLYYVLVVLGISIFAVYVLWQARFLLLGPQITFTTNPPQVETERAITLAGYATNIATLSLDGRPIYTDKNGYFKETLVLENGYTIATIDAADRYGRTRTYTKHFVYTPALTKN